MRRRTDRRRQTNGWTRYTEHVQRRDNGKWWSRPLWEHDNGSTVVPDVALGYYWERSTGGYDYCGIAATLRRAKAAAVPRCKACGCAEPLR